MEEITTEKVFTDNNNAEKSSEENSIDLIELVRSKHENSYHPKENSSDVIVMQIILCIIIAIIFAIINIIEPEITQDFTKTFKSMTNGETEKIFEKAVFTVMNFING